MDIVSITYIERSGLISDPIPVEEPDAELEDTRLIETHPILGWGDYRYRLVTVDAHGERRHYLATELS